MVRLVQITLPVANPGLNSTGTGQKPHELLMDLLMEMDHVHCLAAFSGDNCHLLSFKSPEKHVGHLVDKLEALGVGINFGTIDVLELLSTQPRITTYGEPENNKRRKYQWNERLSMTEVYETIDAQSHLTFNYVAMVCTAAFIAAIGLVSDSPTTVVASMLLSPLMGPILSLTLGIFVSSHEMTARGFRNEAWGLFIALLIGMGTGFVIAPFHGPGGVPGGWASYELRSEEMETRGDLWNLLTGFAIAIPSGVGVSLAITGGGINALVGVAISAALLPPIVNSGIGLAMGLFYAGAGHPGESDHFLMLSLVSCLLFVVNLITILLVGLFMFRLKNVEPLKDRSAEWRTGMQFSDSLLSSSFRRPEGVREQVRRRRPPCKMKPAPESLRASEPRSLRDCAWVRRCIRSFAAWRRSSRGPP